MHHGRVGAPQRLGMECTVCFEPVDGGVRCKNRSCTSLMCLPCVSEYLDVALGDKRIPKCPCNTYYLLSDLPPGLAAKYGQCCLAELVGKHGDAVRKRWETSNVLVELRKARLVFLTQRFPAAIAYTAQVIMPHKLRALDKQVTERTKKKVQSTRRICMNLTCSGSLDENLTCMTCHTFFCNDCEKVRRDGHVCDPNDVESVQAIRQIMRCPNCNLPIHRSAGCNYMTCANCNHNFNYITGEASDHGSHNAAIPQQVAESRLLSVVHRDVAAELGLTDLLLRFESVAPPPVSTTILTNVLMRYYKHEQVSTPALELDLAKGFERYILGVFTQSRYQRAASEVESKLASRTLTAADIHALLLLLSRPI